MTKPRKYTDEQRSKVKELASQGVAIAAISTQTGVSPSTVGFWLRHPTGISKSSYKKVRSKGPTTSTYSAIAVMTEDSRDPEKENYLLQQEIVELKCALADMAMISYRAKGSSSHRATT